jgi:hypothetical protein
MSDDAKLLARLLVFHEIVDAAAIEDAEGYDGGLTLAQIQNTAAGLGIGGLRAEIERLKSLLTYAAPSVDHACLAGDLACKRCAIDYLLKAKP